MLILDTNIYLDAAGDEVVERRLQQVIEESGTEVAVSSVVVAELLFGGSEHERGALQQHVSGVVTQIVTPNHDDWVLAGNALRLLGGDAVTTRRSFWNDLLIATSCARAGAIVLTSKKSDFARIRRVIPVQTISLQN